MNLSKDSEFSLSELAALSPWNLPNISVNKRAEPPKKASETVEVEEGSARILTVDEIEAMQKQAYDEAFAQGNKDGFQQGLDRGLQEGRIKGYEEQRQLLLDKASAFGKLMEALSEPFKLLDDEVEKELVKLAFTIATQIIRREIKLDPGQVVAAVREAIQVLPLSSQKIKLHLHPEDAELVRSALSLDEMTTAWGVIEDPMITRGGCKVDTDVSHVDATVENRMAALIAAVMGGERGYDSKQAAVGAIKAAPIVEGELSGSASDNSKDSVAPPLPGEIDP